MNILRSLFSLIVIVCFVISTVFAMDVQNNCKYLIEPVVKIDAPKRKKVVRVKRMTGSVKHDNSMEREKDNRVRETIKKMMFDQGEDCTYYIRDEIKQFANNQREFIIKLQAMDYDSQIDAVMDAVCGEIENRLACNDEVIRKAYMFAIRKIIANDSILPITKKNDAPYLYNCIQELRKAAEIKGSLLVFVDFGAFSGCSICFSGWREGFRAALIINRSILSMPDREIIGALAHEMGHANQHQKRIYTYGSCDSDEYIKLRYLEEEDADSFAINKLNQAKNLLLCFQSAAAKYKSDEIASDMYPTLQERIKKAQQALEAQKSLISKINIE